MPSIGYGLLGSFFLFQRRFTVLRAYGSFAFPAVKRLLELWEERFSSHHDKRQKSWPSMFGRSGSLPSEN